MHLLEPRAVAATILLIAGAHGLVDVDVGLRDQGRGQELVEDHETVAEESAELLRLGSGDAPLRSPALDTRFRIRCVHPSEAACCASRYIAASQSPRNATGTPADSSASRTSAATGPSFFTVRTTSDSCVPLGREAQVGAHQSSHNTLVDPVRRQRFDSPHGPFLLPLRTASQVPSHGREDGAPSPSGPSSPDLRPTPTPRLG